MSIRLEGYFDASGKQEAIGDKAIIVAGLLSSSPKLREFEKLWLKTLNDAGISATNGVPVFHTTDFMARKSVYATWTQEKRDLFYRNLIEIICQTTLYRVGIAVLLEDYRRFLVKCPESIKMFGSAGYFASVMCFNHCADWADKVKYKDTISYIFDRGDTFNSEIRKAHDNLCDEETFRNAWHFEIDALTFGNKARFTPIQGADVIAWELSKALKKAENAPIGANYLRPSFNALNSNGSEFRCYSYEDLEFFWAEYLADENQEMKRKTG